MDVVDLVIVERVSLSVDKVLDGVQLVHHGVVRVVHVVVNGFAVHPEQLVIELVVASLLQPQVHHPAKHFEQILYDVF